MSAVKRPSTVVVRWFLVDGVQMDPNLINPQDVASISVLKDAASASIYGARAAYGVILITTQERPQEICLHKCHSMHLSHSTARQPVRNI